MNVCIGRISLRLTDSHSLKSRRQTARSLTARIRGRFNVAVAEDAAADGNAWQRLTLVVSCLSSDASHTDTLLSRVVDYIADSRPDITIVDYGTETISGV